MQGIRKFSNCLVISFIYEICVAAKSIPVDLSPSSSSLPSNLHWDWCHLSSYDLKRSPTFRQNVKDDFYTLVTNTGRL